MPKHFALPEATSKRLCDRFVNAYTPTAMCRLERSIENGKNDAGARELRASNMEASSCGEVSVPEIGNRMCC